MKKFIFFILLLLINVLIFSIENWKAYTNTSYIFSIEKMDNKIALATWGGIKFFDYEKKEFRNTLTTMDKLSDNFVKDITYDNANDILYIATNSKGVDRFFDNKIIMPISNIVGLNSDNVNKIVIKDSLIFVATKSGLSVFYNNSQSTFPILIKNFSQLNGLSSDNITALSVNNNYIFCGSGNGVDYMELDSLEVAGSTWKHLTQENTALPDNIINDIDSNGDITAIATKKGLVCFSNPQNNLSWRIYENGYSIYPIYIKDNKVYFSYGYWDEEHLTIVKDDDEKGYFSVIYKPLSDGDLKKYSTDKLSDQIMGFKIFDNDLYINTWGDGLYYSADLQNWINYLPNCPIANNIFRVKLDKNNKLWLATGHHGAYPSATGTKGVSSFDGTAWENYSFENSPLTSNNIISIGVDEENNVWFGSRWNPGDSEVDWDNAISIYKQSENIWDTLYVSDNFVMDMYFDEENHRKWLTFYDRGVTILNDKNEIEYSFEIYGSSDQKVVKTLPAMDKVFFGFWFDGIIYWDDPGLPDHNIYKTLNENDMQPKNFRQEEKWIKPPANELRTGKVYDIAYRLSKFGEKQVWFAMANGLFMFNGENWYWYGPIQKKRILAASFNWEPDELDEQEYHTPEYWYVVGQERLYGSAITFPTALFVDPFGSIWIGTQDHGITRFYPDEDIYINYYMDNSPLLSNTINDFAYNADTGELFIATPKGLNSVYIGITDEKNTVTKLNDETIVYPNPFSPYKGDILNIKTTKQSTMPKGKTYCKIYDLNGTEIIKLKKNDYQQFEWDGKNKAGKYCAPGIYFYVIYTQDGQIAKKKFVIVR